MSDELIDELARIAHQDSPPPLAEDDLDRMIGAALEAVEDGGEASEGGGEADAKPAARGRWWFAAAAAALLALGGGYLLGGRGEPPSLEARLASGDLLVASPGARFEVLEQGPAVRRLELREGLVLFDVEPLGPEGRFEVVTPHGVVRVRGTVFSIEAGDETRVRVYEGRVEVERDGATVTLGEGEAWRNGERTPWDPGPLAARAADAVAARASQRPRAPASETETETASASESASDSQSASESVSASQSDSDSESASESESESASQSNSVSASQSDSVSASQSNSASASASASDSASDSDSDSDSAAATASASDSASDSDSDSDSAAATASQPDSASPPRPTRADVGRWLARGDYDRARAVAAARGWVQLEADALRALGRFEEAADRYDRVAAGGNGTAAFEAAQLRFQRLGDPAGALASLRAAPAPDTLTERRLGLEARLLVRLGRSEEARAIAERYLEGHPEGGLARWMTELRDGAE